MLSYVVAGRGIGLQVRARKCTRRVGPESSVLSTSRQPSPAPVGMPKTQLLHLLFHPQGRQVLSIARIDDAVAGRGGRTIAPSTCCRMHGLIPGQRHLTSKSWCVGLRLELARWVRRAHAIMQSWRPFRHETVLRDSPAAYASANIRRLDFESAFIVQVDIHKADPGDGIPVRLGTAGHGKPCARFDVPEAHGPVV